MICRMWRGWTRPENADAYNHYLNNELFLASATNSPNMAIAGPMCYAGTAEKRSSS